MIDPYYDKAYINRGIAKSKIGLDYCDDLFKGCNLNREYCSWYEQYCK